VGPGRGASGLEYDAWFVEVDEDVDSRRARAGELVEHEEVVDLIEQMLRT
jgi:hypothetical protein